MRLPNGVVDVTSQMPLFYSYVIVILFQVRINTATPMSPIAFTFFHVYIEIRVRVILFSTD